jgi:hypothetical protein
MPLTLDLMKRVSDLLLKAHLFMATQISKMEAITINALDSANPFSAPIPPPKRLDGQPVVREREPVTIAPESPVTPVSVPEPVTVPEVVVNDSKAILEETQSLFDDIEPPRSQNPIIESRSPEGLPSYRCEFAGRDIFVGWPWYKHSNPVTAAINVAMALDFGKDKIRFDMAIGDAKIEHARNRLAHKFLETDAKWLLMIDDDIIPAIGRPNWFRYWVQGARQILDMPLQRHVLHRLVGAGKTLVGAAYFGRQEGGALMASDQRLASKARTYEDAVVPVDWVGTGCMLIHRKVFDDIRSKYGDSLKINVPDYEYDYFRPFDSARGEDVSFCIRAKEAGHQPHLDLGLPVFHVGYKTY